MAKLTLSVDEEVVAGAKRFAAARGTSVSQLVERYLTLLSRPEEPPPAPVLLELRGLLKEGSREDYRRHLVRKYR